MAETERPAAEKLTGKLSVAATLFASFQASFSRFSGGQWIVEKTLTMEGERCGLLVEMMMQRQVEVEKLTRPHRSIFGENDERAASVALRDLGVVFVVMGRGVRGEGFRLGRLEDGEKERKRGDSGSDEERSENQAGKL